MKRVKKTLYIICCVITTISCSDESIDQGDASNTIEVEGNYFPSAVNDYWNYTVESTNNSTSETIVSNDSLYVTGQTASGFTLGVNNNMFANGAMNGLLISGNLTRTDVTLSLDGALQLPTELADVVDFEIDLDNIILYNVNANIGTMLSTNTNTIQQDFNGFPITINYTLSTIAQGFSEALSVNGQNYNNVTTTDLKLNLSVSTSVPFGPVNLDINILDPQDVLVSRNYFAKNIGLINSETNTTYQISATAITALETAGVTLDFPTSNTSSNIQVLNDYMITE